jgi:hypothetical protein
MNINVTYATGFGKKFKSFLMIHLLFVKVVKKTVAGTQLFAKNKRNAWKTSQGATFRKRVKVEKKLSL